MKRQPKKVIQNFKNNYERNLSYKAEQKEKNKGKSSSHAGAAAAIKTELQKAFPGIKFSVTSDSYSMGDSVHIGWEDGPTTKEVEAISGKYQYGSFNSMEDLYEHTNSRDDIPQTKYVSENRSQSEIVKALLPDFTARFHPDQLNGWHNKPEQIFYRLFSKTSLPANYTGLGIVRTDCIAGSVEDFYQFTFNVPESATQQAAAPQFKEVETKAGEVNIVDYSEKAIAVIGDTKPIKDKLKALGGSFNPRLSCGAGWIFPKRKLAEITAALSESEQQTTEPEKKKTGSYPNTYIEAKKATQTEIQWYNLKPESYILTICPFQWFPTDILCSVVNGKYEDGHNIGVTISGNLGSAGIGIVNLEAATEMLRAKGYEVRAEPDTVKSEVKKMIEFFAETDIKQCGEITESTKECARVQNVDLAGLIEETPKHYDNLQDIEAAAQGGKVISLYNLCELVNTK